MIEKLFNTNAMRITGTHFNYYRICHRKLWLFANGVQMEHNSDLVYEGKLLHENSYLRRPERYQEIELDGIKIDFYDVNNGIVHEIKKSDKHEEAHEWQVKYYLYKLQQHGVNASSGILEYPRLHKKTEVILSSLDKEEIQKMENHIIQISMEGSSPSRLHRTKCKNCSYFDFCWSGEKKSE